MHPIVIFDLVSFFASLSAFILLLNGWKSFFTSDIKLLLACLLVFTLSYNFFIFLEGSGINKNLDLFEDLVGALIPMWWAFIFYAFLQQIAGSDLRESEKFRTSLLENSPVPILVLNPDTSIRYVNPALEILTGFSFSEIHGTKAPYPWWTEAPESGNISERKEDIIAGVRERVKSFRKKKGEQFWVDITTIPIMRKGELKYALTTWIDITELKQEKDQLTLRDQILENMCEGVVLSDEEANIFYTNKAFDAMLGYERGELIGKHISILYPQPPEESKKITDKIVSQLKSHSLWSGELDRMRKDGTIIKAYVSISVLDVEGKFNWIAVQEDFTERKQIEEQLQRARKMEAIGTLAGGVAHDLNNILSGIVNYPELLLMDLPEDSPYRDSIENIQKSGKKAADIVQDLLTLARRGVAISEVVNLNHIISEYIKSPEHRKLKSFHPDVQLEINFATDLLHILGSPVHLSKTVMNLISNAAEAMPLGGKITISTENRYIEKPIKGYDKVDKGDYVTLKVSDTGIGISEENIERIFEPFYSKKIMGRSGTGLGMAVVWGTAKDHSGYIDVESNRGKGTTFKLYFPATRKELTEAVPELSMGDYIGNGESILIIDDVKEQRAIASKILSKLNYNISAVSSGEEAVDFMKKNSMDLLVLDMIMGPGNDGLDTYKKILEGHPGQKAIIASGFSETDRVKEVQKLGAGRYIKKPYTFEKMGIAVKEELQK